MPLKIAVLTVGDELLSGEMADTNTARIARALAGHGYRLRDSLTVRDVEVDIEEALLSLAGRRDAVIVTGGLGPTADDLTARAAARAFKRRLTVYEEALAQIREHFRRAGRAMDPRNERQALLPQNAQVLPNPIGSAPGFLLHHNGREFFFLPGVPDEVEVMLHASVLPHLQERTGGIPPGREVIYTIFGLPEPKVEETLSTVSLPEGVEVAFGVDFPYIHLKLRASGSEARSLLDRCEPPLRRLLDRHIVAVGDETPAVNVARLLCAGELSVSLAESCTGGLLAAMLTEIPGSSAFFDRAAVTYADNAKSEWLGVPVALLKKEGAVSEGCALAMARGMRTAAGTDLALAITGIAGPSGGTVEKPVGTVYLALAAPGTERVRGYRFSGDRGRIRRMAACMGLEWLRRYLVDRLETPPDAL